MSRRGVPPIGITTATAQAAAQARKDAHRRPSTSTSAAATPPYVTPAVRKAAPACGVDLATVTGTGVGGRIRVDDVYAAAPATRAARPARDDAGPGHPSRFTRPTLLQTHRSQIDPAQDVTIDAFSLNPLIDELRQVSPTALDAATAFDRNVPGMFESGGEVPLFTAGGFDPQLLLRLPWQVRHLAASTEKATTVAEIFERCGSGTLEAVHWAGVLGGPGHPGLRAYTGRVNAWLQAPSLPRQDTRRIVVGRDGKPQITGEAPR